MSAREVLPLRREKGRKITAHEAGHQVALIVWSKIDTPLLPLVLDADEAERLATMLRAAVTAARDGR